MNIGEKIAKIRTAAGISQEELAEKISVSRQSVSKWEAGGALPGCDKIRTICELFGISCDDLLLEEREPPLKNREPRKNKYFGTDGFRGEVNRDLTSLHAYKIGRFLGWYYKSDLSGRKRGAYRPKIVIGKDTRRSSYMLEYALAAGITASGADAYMLHVTTTPSVSYVARTDGFDAAVMITASHNPYYDNGIKVLNSHGEKLDDSVTLLIEAYIDGDYSALGLDSDIPEAVRDNIGQIVDYVSGRNRYLGYIISIASNSYRTKKIGIDSANGASWMIARSVFEALGAEVTVIADEPDGTNINKDCGSTHIERLASLVKERHLDMGFAFDGDCDRCIAVDERGDVVDGDAIMYILAKRLKERGMLASDTVVCTVMSNSGFVKSLSEIGIKCVETDVGDRFVYEKMQGGGYSLGGEQSGHIIIKKYATTGDGILTAIMLAEEVCDKKCTLSRLAAGLEIYPQTTASIRVASKDAVFKDEGVKAALEEVRADIGDEGRVLLRKSGTEPVVRIMVESKSLSLCETYTEKIADAIERGGHIVD